MFSSAPCKSHDKANGSGGAGVTVSGFQQEWSLGGGGGGRVGGGYYQAESGGVIIEF